MKLNQKILKDIIKEVLEEEASLEELAGVAPASQARRQPHQRTPVPEGGDDEAPNFSNLPGGAIVQRLMQRQVVADATATLRDVLGKAPAPKAAEVMAYWLKNQLGLGPEHVTYLKQHLTQATKDDNVNENKRRKVKVKRK
tara:strand:+ start:1117 stop:1539 length:423 start_codon:yes stop_codon:yes gene_type:complete